MDKQRLWEKFQKNMVSARNEKLEREFKSATYHNLNSFATVSGSGITVENTLNNMPDELLASRWPN